MNLENVPTSSIVADQAFNVRKDLTSDINLVESVRALGIQSPLLVQRKGTKNILIAGFRRYAAAMELGLTEVPVVFAAPKASKADLALLNLVENTARTSLSPIDEARGIENLQKLGMERDRIREATGWSETLITQRLGLLKLSVPLQNAIGNGDLTVRQAPIIDQLPVAEHEAMIEKAKDMPIDQLRRLVDIRLNAINRTDDTEPETVAEAERMEGIETTRSAPDDTSQRAASIVASIGTILEEIYADQPDELQDAMEQLSRISFTPMNPAHLAILDNMMSEAAAAAAGVGEQEPDDEPADEPVAKKPAKPSKVAKLPVEKIDPDDFGGSDFEDF